MKLKSNFVCQQCGYSQVGWSGKCPQCDAWGSLVETVVEQTDTKNRNTRSGQSAKTIKLSSIKKGDLIRKSTNISELDRVLGGGLVPGQVVLLAGEPGIGKSTILLQVSESMGNSVYVSGEESARQVKIRADRLGFSANKIEFIESTNIDSIIAAIKNLSTKTIDVVIIDSVQTMYTSDLTGMAGSVGQVREVASRLVNLAKSRHIPVIIVGHVTKQGSVAGPATLAHIVDSVLWFEGDKSLTLRILRSIKNRFGPTDEIGIFRMEDRGLIGVDNPDNIFVTSGRKAAVGAVKTCIITGSRPVVVEIQSLVTPSHTAYPKRIAQGIDSKKLEVLLALLTSKLKLKFYERDVFVSVVGGLSVREPSADLAILLSLTSAYKNKEIDSKVVAVGEVDLLGDIRQTVFEDKRLQQAKRQGFVKAISSLNAQNLSEAINQVFRS